MLNVSIELILSSDSVLITEPGVWGMPYKHQLNYMKAQSQVFISLSRVILALKFYCLGHVV